MCVRACGFMRVHVRVCVCVCVCPLCTCVCVFVHACMCVCTCDIHVCKFQYITTYIPTFRDKLKCLTELRSGLHSTNHYNINRQTNHMYAHVQGDKGPYKEVSFGCTLIYQRNFSLPRTAAFVCVFIILTSF